MDIDWFALVALLAMAILVGIFYLPDASVFISSTQFRIRFRPLVNWAFAWFFLWLSGLSITVALFSVSDIGIFCQRSIGTETVDCEIRELDWWGKELVDLHLGDLRQANFEPVLFSNESNSLSSSESPSSFEQDESVRLVLRGINTAYEFQDNLRKSDLASPSISYDYQVLYIQQRLTQFLNGREQQISLSVDCREILYSCFGLGGFFLIIMLIFLISSPFIELNLDQTSQTYELVRRRARGLLGKTWQGTLSEIDKADLETTQGETSTLSRVILRLKSGELIPVTYNYSNISSEYKLYWIKQINIYLKNAASNG
ncbi:hypothetical protein KR51_00000020 [Rubidibacter lacunae KORDI 51-2]|uniref:Uncharacterized protein n=1 Tax=Rubidibacter lacunae KORDI 51-2 TaxID=582515 RepID=U5DR88_9CHRO|nr:hypothetical protein [Rubidibacter lacunae]ERN43114.1 hypothetical protein KR51_00000020 [Rubidibacter lacunae KORDI 51-2]